jgi:hypothetical protein
MSDVVARLNAALEGRYAIERELGEGGMAVVYLNDLIDVQVGTRNGFHVGEAKRLFHLGSDYLLTPSITGEYDVTKDDQRFLFARHPGAGLKAQAARLEPVTSCSGGTENHGVFGQPAQESHAITWDGTGRLHTPLASFLEVDVQVARALLRAQLRATLGRGVADTDGARKGMIAVRD